MAPLALIAAIAALACGGCTTHVDQMGDDDTTTSDDDTSASDDDTGDDDTAPVDADGDGYDDFLVGHDWEDEAFLVRGPVSGTMPIQDAADVVFHGGSDSVYAGSSLASAGDVDGDGWVDLPIGSWYPAWGFLVYGPFGGSYDLSTDAVEFWGENGDIGEMGIGWSVAGPGDVDGDGYDDLLLAGSWNSAPEGAGVAYYVRWGGAGGRRVPTR